MTSDGKSDGHVQEQLPRIDTDGHAPAKDGDASSEDWRELAQRIQRETDSVVMMDLVQQLIIKLDEQKLRKQGSEQK